MSPIWTRSARSCPARTGRAAPEVRGVGRRLSRPGTLDIDGRSPRVRGQDGCPRTRDMSSAGVVCTRPRGTSSPVPQSVGIGDVGWRGMEKMVVQRPRPDSRSGWRPWPSYGAASSPCPAEEATAATRSEKFSALAGLRRIRAGQYLARCESMLRMLLRIRHEKAVPLMSPSFMWATSRERPCEMLVAIACGSKTNDDRLAANRPYFLKNGVSASW